LNEKLAAVEAVLFASGEPVELHRLAEACGLSNADIPPIIKLLNDKYKDGGLQILKLETSYQMATKEKYAAQVKTALDTKKFAPLSNSAMEVLTIIAYNQPVSRSFVENVRGIASNSVFATLADRGLIEEAGRIDVPGRPIAYCTTQTFLRCFGLNSLSELPSLSKSDVSGQLQLEETE